MVSMVSLRRIAWALVWPWTGLTLLALASLCLAISQPPIVAAQSATVPSGTPTELQSPVSVGVPNTTLTLSGCSAPDGFVTIFNDNQPVGAVVAGNNGHFAKQLTVKSGGLFNIKLYFADVNGRTSSVVTKNISLTSHSNTVLNLILPTTLEHEPEPVLVGDYLIFRGTTCPHALVNVTISNNFTLAAQADARGNWYAIADTENYYVGAHTYFGLSAKNGLVSDHTSPYQFTTIGTAGGGLPAPAKLEPPVITHPPDDYLSSSPTVTFRGRGPISTPIEIFVDQKPAGAVYTNAVGEFIFRLNMTSPRHIVSARACRHHTCSELSNEVAVGYAGNLSACSLSFKLEQYRFFGLRPDDGIDLNLIELTGQPDYQVLLDWGDTSIEHSGISQTNSGRWHHVYKQAGLYNGTLVLKDSRGCSYGVYFTVEVSDEPQLNLLWVGLIGSFSAGLIISARQLHWLYRFRRSQWAAEYAPGLHLDAPLAKLSESPSPLGLEVKNQRDMLK